MIDRKAFDAAWEAMGWDNQNPQATEGQEGFIAAYDQARLAALPKGTVDRIKEMILDDCYIADDPHYNDGSCFIEDVDDAARAIAALEPQEVDGDEVAGAVVKHYGNHQATPYILGALRAAGYRIVKGGA